MNLFNSGGLAFDILAFGKEEKQEEEEEQEEEEREQEEEIDEYKFTKFIRLDD